MAGQNNRYNNIQIDGGVNNDLFGLGSTGTPGGQVSERPISLEAVKEFQVLIAPFDVRQGGFTGGLVNAITKSRHQPVPRLAVLLRPEPEPRPRGTVQKGLAWTVTRSGPTC